MSFRGVRVRCGPAMAHTTVERLMEDMPTSATVRRRPGLFSGRCMVFCAQVSVLLVGMTLFAAGLLSNVRASQLQQYHNLNHAHDGDGQTTPHGTRSNPHHHLKSAICYLVDLSDPTHVSDMKKALHYLDRNYLFAFPHTVIIFYPQDTSNTEKHKSILRSVARVDFQRVDLPVPKGLDGTERCRHQDFSLRDCRVARFWTGPVLDHLRHYDYFWRMERTSLLAGPLIYDVFDLMHDHSLGYATVGTMGPRLNRGQNDSHSSLPFFLADHSDLTATNYTYLLTRWNGQSFDTSFEVVSTATLLSAATSQALETLTVSGDVFRWGMTDGEIKTLAVAGTVGRKKIAFLTDILYYHDGWRCSRETVFQPLERSLALAAVLLGGFLWVARSSSWGQHHMLWRKIYNMRNIEASPLMVPALGVLIAGAVLYWPWIESVLYMMVHRDYLPPLSAKMQVTPILISLRRQLLGHPYP